MFRSLCCLRGGRRGVSGRGRRRLPPALFAVSSGTGGSHRGHVRHRRCARHFRDQQFAQRCGGFSGPQGCAEGGRTQGHAGEIPHCGWPDAQGAEIHRPLGQRSQGSGSPHPGPETGRPQGGSGIPAGAALALSAVFRICRGSPRRTTCVTRSGATCGQVA